MDATLTLKDYLEKLKPFIVPDYQRGYVWGKKKDGIKKDSVTYMLENSLLPGYKQNTEIFIQGITVCEQSGQIILIDGQQRTTFFYLLLKYLGYKDFFEIRYNIRVESDLFLRNLKLEDVITLDDKESYQDIYFFKKSLCIISEKLNEFDEIQKEGFLNYLLNNVKFLYINVPEEKATKVFTMMNGNKAEMRSEELIKAEMLRLASQNDKEFEEKTKAEQYALDWDNNVLRSRYAREWDKWLQWWNRKDVIKLYKTDRVMGYLLFVFQLSKAQGELTFEVFRNKFLNKQTPKEAKDTFGTLRKLQKRFEDAFNNPITYNMIGAIIRIGVTQKEEFLNWYFVGVKPSKDILEQYYKMSFLGMTHGEIIAYIYGDITDNDSIEVFDKKFNNLFTTIDSNNLYCEYREEAFRLLFRLNIDEDNKQECGNGRKFDFSIWDGQRSLEHIYPKSKVWHYETIDDMEVVKTGDGIIRLIEEINGAYINSQDCKMTYTTEAGDDINVEASEHSIGNLVLLYGKNNSSFGNKNFEEKKHMFFNPQDKEIFESRHLLHTIYTFATSDWNGEQIARNKKEILDNLKKYYGK